jgi:hypothetical protein
MAKGSKTGGRKKGSRNKNSTAGVGIGITPKELMLEYMRTARKFAKDAERTIKRLEAKSDLTETEEGRLLEAKRDFKHFREEAQSCAKDVAQYCHAKLTSNVHDAGPTLRELVAASFGKTTTEEKAPWQA